MEGFRLQDLKRWGKGFEREPQDQSLSNGSYFHSVHQAGRPVTVAVETTADGQLVFTCDAGIFFAQSEEQAAVLAVLAK